MDIHYFCQILFSTKSKTFNVIFFHESFNVLSILRVKTVFYSSDGFFLKIVELLNPICRAGVNCEINIIEVWSYHTFINSNCCFFRNKSMDFCQNSKFRVGLFPDSIKVFVHG